MTNYIGLDAHSKTCTAVVLNETGKIQATAQFETSEKNLLEFIKSVKRPRELAFEEQCIAQWLYILTKKHVDKLVVAHPSHLPKQQGPKDDYHDAIRAAEELRANRLVPVFHENSRLFNLRAIVNSYHDFVADLVRSKNRYKAIFRSRGIPFNDRKLFTDEAFLKQLDVEEELYAAEMLFRQIQQQQSSKDSYEDKFATLAKQWPVIHNLCSIPGISTIRASIITAIICSPARFANKHKLWAYSKLIRYIDTSDGRIYGTREPHGRDDLKEVFMGAAMTVLMGSSGLRKYYDRLISKGVCHNDAKRAVARRIAAISLMIMKTGVRYDDHHEDKRRRLQTKQA
jgi:transposase